MSPILVLALAVVTPDPALNAPLEEIAKRHSLPAIAVYASNKDTVREAAWGVRKLGDATPVTLTDRWHLGSDTKAMTATLAAIFVEQGKLGWDTTVATALADWTDLDPAFKSITLEMLLSHRTGLGANVPDDLRKKMNRPKQPDGQRQAIVHELLRRPPTGKTGAFAYSNLGYMVAGVMLEKLAGDTWENLMRAKLFAPLEMSSCGFGAPATAPDKVDAPWAHKDKDGELTAIEPGPRSDNPPQLGPAGTVHCSLADWHTFVKMHVRGERGVATRVGIAQATFEKLHTAVSDNYALGWGVTAYPQWKTARVISHDGSNTMFYVTVLAVPAEDIVILVATNRGGDEARDGAKEAALLLAR